MTIVTDEIMELVAKDQNSANQNNSYISFKNYHDYDLPAFFDPVRSITVHQISQISNNDSWLVNEIRINNLPKIKNIEEKNELLKKISVTISGILKYLQN